MKTALTYLYRSPLIRSIVTQYALKLATYGLNQAIKLVQKKNAVVIQADNYDEYFNTLIGWVISKGVLEDSQTVRLRGGSKGKFGIPEGKIKFKYFGKVHIVSLERLVTDMELREFISITILKGNTDDVQRIIEEASAESERSPTIKLQLYQHDYWNRLDNKNIRAEETFILKDGQREKILGDMEWFYENRQWYIDRGIPYHRGYLFTGPPGTGKTTIISVAASKFHKPVCVINLSAVSNDDSLMKSVAQAPSGAIIALEDIDCVVASNSREGKETIETKGVTLAGVLNVLDGMMTPDGSIFILTTNFPDKLDSALIRPGRVDVQEEFGFLEKNEQYKLSRLFYDADVGVDKPLGAALLQNIFMKNLNDPAAAQKELELL